MILIFWIKKYNHPEEYVMGEGGVGSRGGGGGQLPPLLPSPLAYDSFSCLCKKPCQNILIINENR